MQIAAGAMGWLQVVWTVGGGGFLRVSALACYRANKVRRFILLSETTTQRLSPSYATITCQYEETDSRGRYHLHGSNSISIHSVHRDLRASLVGILVFGLRATRDKKYKQCYEKASCRSVRNPDTAMAAGFIARPQALTLEASLGCVDARAQHVQI
jgi:hypothetical protein